MTKETHVNFFGSISNFISDDDDSINASSSSDEDTTRHDEEATKCDGGGSKETNSDKPRRKFSKKNTGGLFPKQLRWTFENSVDKMPEGEHWFLYEPKLSGEKKMWWSVLAQAMFEHLGGKDERGRARDWIYSRRYYVGSYVWVCEILSIDGERLLRRVDKLEIPVDFSRWAIRTWGCFNRNREQHPPFDKVSEGGEVKS